MGHNEPKPIAELRMRKDNGRFTEKEVTGIVGSFLKRAFKGEAEKMAEKQMVACPIYSSMALIPGKIAGQVELKGLVGTCLGERCGMWALCPANKESAIYDVVRGFQQCVSPIMTEGDL